MIMLMIMLIERYYKVFFVWNWKGIIVIVDGSLETKLLLIDCVNNNFRWEYHRHKLQIQL